MPDEGFNPSAFENPLLQSVADSLDGDSGLKHFRSEFVIPRKADLKRKTATELDNKASDGDSSSAIYLCGNSLGLRPKRTRDYLDQYLATWATQGVYGHFKALDGALTRPWMHIDSQTSAAMAPIVGAQAGEVAVMETLTANLHLLLASFYRPTRQRFKIVIEGKAFPSDHFAAQSQLAQHGYAARDALVLVEPDERETHYFSTKHVLDTIAAHADSTALILLPGIHFYSGQLLDIPTITKFAHEKDIIIGWDLAHAVGNVALQLHDWQVDFAAWCTYKYLNGGPGCIGGLFVHEKHGSVQSPPDEAAAKEDQTNDVLTGGLEAEQRYGYRHRLCGWWGSSKATRFDMNNVFVPIAGAAGWQLSNPSMLDSTSVIASLSIFNETSMAELRRRSIMLTGYLEYLLLNWPCDGKRPYVLLTPSNPNERGAQLSVKLAPGLLDGVLEDLEAEGIVVDERKPDVIRVAPAPLYNTFGEVWQFVNVLCSSLGKRH